MQGLRPSSRSGASIASIDEPNGRQISQQNPEKNQLMQQNANLASVARVRVGVVKLDNAVCEAKRIQVLQRNVGLSDAIV
jgi:hypothetical protein